LTRLAAAALAGTSLESLEVVERSADRDRRDGKRASRVSQGVGQTRQMMA
jgi:hypothetical protein